MSHLRNVERVVRVALSPVQQAIAAQAGQAPNPTRVTVTVHAVTCNCQSCDSATHRHQELQNGEFVWVTGHPCVHEYLAPAETDYEWYVPLGWAIYPDGTHKCPDCRTKAAVDADRKEQRNMVRAFERQYGDACVNCGKNWDEHHHPELRHPDACQLHVHGRELARPLYKVRQHGYGLVDWDKRADELGEHHRVGHLVKFGQLQGGSKQ